MRLAEARARSSALWESFISTDAKGSSCSCERAINTTSRSQGGTEGGRGECNLQENSPPARAYQSIARPAGNETRQ